MGREAPQMNESQTTVTVEVPEGFNILQRPNELLGTHGLGTNNPNTGTTTYRSVWAGKLCKSRLKHTKGRIDMIP